MGHPKKRINQTSPNYAYMIEIYSNAKNLHPLQSLILQLDMIDSAAEARNSARWIACQIFELRPAISEGLTAWWLDNLRADQSIAPVERAGELINAVAIGRSAPVARRVIHDTLEADIQTFLENPEHAATLLQVLSSLIAPPNILPDTRLRVFKAAKSRQEALNRLLPPVVADNALQCLAQIARVEWPDNRNHPAIMPLPVAESSTQGIIIHARTDMTRAAQNAAVELTFITSTPARLAYLDDLYLQVGQSLKPQQQFEFMAALHGHLMFQPDLVTPSRTGLIEAFHCAAPLPEQKEQLTRKFQPLLAQDGPLNAFFQMAVPRNQPVAPPKHGWLKRLCSYFKNIKRPG